MLLSEFFNEKIIKEPSGNQITLKEKHGDGSRTLQKISLDKSNTTVVIKLDEHSDYWFKKKETMCDYVIFVENNRVENNRTVQCLLIELKSTEARGKKSEAITQIKAGKRICEFFLDIYNLNLGDTCNTEYKGIILFLPRKQSQRAIKKSIKNNGQYDCIKIKVKYYTDKNNSMNLSKLL